MSAGSIFTAATRHKHPAAVIANKNKSLDPLRAKNKIYIYKKEVGPYRGFGYSSLISDPLNPSASLFDTIMHYS